MLVSCFPLAKRMLICFLDGGRNICLLKWGMNGCSSSSISIVNAEDHSMGGVVEGKIGIADDTSPPKVVIKKAQAELSQKYRARDETKQELEFLEKGGNLLDYKLQYVASASVQSTSATDPRNDRLVTNDTNGSSVFVTSSHRDPVETSGGPGVVPSEADSADNLMYFDAETEFFEGGRSLSHPCRNDIPLEPSLNINETQKHSDSAASTLPRKAYKRRYRPHPNCDGARSSSMNVDPSPGYEVEKQDTKLPLLSSSIKPVEGSLVKKESSGDPPLYDLDVSKSVESMKNHVECVSRPTQPDCTDSSNPLHPQLSQEQPSAPRSPKGRGFDGLEGIEVIERKTVSVSDSQLSLSSRRDDDQMTTHETNGFKNEMEFEKSTDALTSDPHAAGVLESDLANRATGINNGRINTNEIVTTVDNIDSSASSKGHILPGEASEMDIQKSVTSKKDHEENENLSLLKQKTDHGPPNLPKNGFLLQSIEGSAQSISNSSKLIAHVTAEKLETHHFNVSDPSRKHDDPSFENPNAHNEASCSIRQGDSFDANYSNPKQSGLPHMVSGVDENTILEKAQLIEAKRKRFMELSMVALPSKIQRRSHWDYVLEEMTWLSNDFAQERLWKTAAAAQTSFEAAVACRMRKADKSSGMAAKIVARTLAKAVLEFWESVAVQGTDEILQQKNPRNNAIRAYAARLIVSHKPTTLFCQAALSLKQDSTSDWEFPDFPEDNNPYQEQSFYIAPPGAMGTYRTAVISHVADIEKIGIYVQEESEMSACDGIVGFGFQDNLYDENEGDTRTFDLPDGRKKLKRLKHGHGMGSYEAMSDLPLQRSEIKLVKHEPGSLTKRPGSSLNVSVPTKRVRTATRRVISPFNAGASGSLQLQNKTDASSGDTSSLQDDLSTVRAGFVYPNTLETDSAQDYEKQTPLESAEVSMMPKKKKAKHMNDDYDPRWQADSRFNEQRDRFRRRSEAHLLESNGNGGLFGQPMIKKPKVLRQSRDHSFDNPTQTPPVVAQFSNIHHPNKFVKILAGREPGRKVKGPKIPTGQSGSENPWSVFEDQALVVLVHDHGPNWELISDAFNSALHFKCIFRNAEECKERHHTLMDRNSCDGADCADSGPSQPYPSALPGIPKGSARQLFQRLLGPVEEDTLKSHFEKIITIGQKQLLRRSQDPKQLLQPHSSHSAALSQVFPNNLNGTSILTPLDLCDVVQGPDVFSTGMQVVHTAGPSGMNQGMNNPMLPASPGSALQGSPNMAAGTSFSSPSYANSSARDGRHVIPRSGPLSADDQQKIQQYNQMVTGRNLSQATLPALGALVANDRGVRINAGVMGSGNRSFPMARPGLPGTPTHLVNSGGMAPSAFPPNVHAGLVTGHGSPKSRSNDALQLMRPGMGQDSPRQIAAGAVQGVPLPRGLSSPLPNQTVSTPVSPYPINHQTTLPMSPQRPQAQLAYVDGKSNHAPAPPQQSFGPRFVKDRQLQQRMMLQQTQQQFAASNSLGRQVQSKPQLPIPSPIQTASQSHPPKNSPVNLSSLPPSSSMNSMPQHQQKAALGVVQNTPSGGNLVISNTGKQQGRQHHLPQSSRHHPQRQHLQAPQQVKVAKGGSPGNVIPQPGDSSIPNGVMASPVTQSLDKREAGSQLVQNSSLNTGSTVSSMQPSRPSNSVPQQKFNSGHGTSAMKHIQTSKPDSSNHGHASPVTVPAANDGQQSCSPLVGATSDGVLNSLNNATPLSSNSYDTVGQEGQGLGERPSTIKNDANEQMQQQSQVQKSPSQASPMQNPSQPAQAPQQSPLLPAGNGSLNGRPDDPGPG